MLNDYVNVSISTPQDFMENPNPIKKIIIKEKINNLLFVAVGATARTHNLKDPTLAYRMAHPKWTLIKA